MQTSDGPLYLGKWPEVCGHGKKNVLREDEVAAVGCSLPSGLTVVVSRRR